MRSLRRSRWCSARVGVKSVPATAHDSRYEPQGPESRTASRFLRRSGERIFRLLGSVTIEFPDVLPRLLNTYSSVDMHDAV